MNTYKIEHDRGKIDYIIDAIKTLIYRNYIFEVKTLITKIGKSVPMYIKKNEIITMVP